MKIMLLAIKVILLLYIVKFLIDFKKYFVRRNKPKVDLSSLYKSLEKKNKKGEVTF